MRDDPTDMPPAAGREIPARRRHRVARLLFGAATLPILLGLLIRFGWPDAGASEPPVLASYFYNSMSPAHIAALAERGFNTGLIKYPIEEWTATELAELRLRVELGDSLGVAIWPTVNAHNKRLLAEVSPGGRVFRDRRGRAHAEVPCPADTAYWSAWWEEMVMPAAGVAAVVAIDLELYGAGDLHHWPPSPSTSRQAILEYTGYTGINEHLAEPWLERLGERDLEDLAAAQRRNLAAFFTAACGRLQAAGVRLAVLDLGRPGLVTRALALALERLDMPVLDFSELTYAKGSRVEDEVVTATYGDLGLRVSVVPGYWLYRWHPGDLERDAVLLGGRHQGYWIFTSLSLHVPPGELEGHYRLQDTQEAYWQSLATANLLLMPDGSHNQ